jgi:hypothetical protein
VGGPGPDGPGALTALAGQDRSPPRQTPVLANREADGA